MQILFPAQISLSHVLRVFTSRVRVLVSHLTGVCWEFPLYPRGSEDCYHHYPHPVLQLIWSLGLPCHTLPCVLCESLCKVLQSFLTYTWLQGMMDKLVACWSYRSEYNSIPGDKCSYLNYSERKPFHRYRPIDREMHFTLASIYFFQKQRNHSLKEAGFNYCSFYKMDL